MNPIRPQIAAEWQGPPWCNKFQTTQLQLNHAFNKFQYACLLSLVFVSNKPRPANAFYVNIKHASLCDTKRLIVTHVLAAPFHIYCKQTEHIEWKYGLAWNQWPNSPVPVVAGRFWLATIPAGCVSIVWNPVRKRTMRYAHMDGCGGLLFVYTYAYVYRKICYPFEFRFPNHIPPHTTP